MDTLPYSVIPRSAAAAVHLVPEANPEHCDCYRVSLFILDLALLSLL